MIISPTAEPNQASSSSHTTYRIKRGSKLADIQSRHETPPSLSALNGPFQLSEYLALKVHHDPHDINALVDVPRSDDTSGGKAPDSNVWIYEHLRRIPIDLTPLITSLQSVCSKQSCPEMKADQWLYFCSAHQQAADCSAIDYILHTVDTTTALLNSSLQFPSRLSIPPASLSHFPSLFRRLSRIFSHAYFQHRETFQLCESETSLYARFVVLCEKYDLVGSKILVIPPEVVGTFGPGKGAAAEDEDDNDDSSEDDEEDEEEDEEEASPSAGGRGRGEKGDEAREKRTRSLDRHPPPMTSPVNLKKPPTTALDKSPVRPKFDSQETMSPGKEDPFRASPRSGGTISRGTLGRGKQSRGTMLWTSDESVPPLAKPGLSTTTATFGTALSRTESNQTAVLINEPEQDASAVEEPPVPKDEIELLEEEGVIPPEPTISPLPPPGTEGGKKDTDGELENVPLNEEGVAADQSKDGTVFKDKESKAK